MKPAEFVESISKALDEGLKELGITEEQREALYDRMMNSLKEEAKE